MRKPLVDLLEQLEADVIDEAKPVSAILRTCIVIARLAKAPQLRQWALHELKGYSPEQEFPPYRTFSSPAYIDGYTPISKYKGVVLSPFSTAGWPIRHILTRPLNIEYPIDAIESFVAGSDDVLHLTPQNLPALLTHLNQHSGADSPTTRLYWMLPKAELEGLLGQIRTSLTEFVDELMAEVESSGTAPSPEETKAVLGRAMPWIQINIGQLTTVTAQRYTRGDAVGEKNIIKRNKTKISENFGTIVATSAHVKAVTQPALDLRAVKEFVTLIHTLTPQLDLAAPDQAELDDALTEIETAAMESGYQHDGFLNALERSNAAIGKATTSFARKAALGATEDLANQAIDADPYMLGQRARAEAQG